MEASMCIMGCQPIIYSLVIFKKLIWVDVKHPLTNFWGVNSRLDSPSENFLNPTETCCPPCPTSKNIWPLHCWRPLDHKSHIECLSHQQNTCLFASFLNLVNFWQTRFCSKWSHHYKSNAIKFLTLNISFHLTRTCMNNWRCPCEVNELSLRVVV